MRFSIFPWPGGGVTVYRRNLQNPYFFLLEHLQGGQDKENCEVDLDDDGLVVIGKGVGEVGDDDQDGGGQEGCQQAACQRAGELKDHLKARQALKCCWLKM